MVRQEIKNWFLKILNAYLIILISHFQNNKYRKEKHKQSMINSLQENTALETLLT